MTVTAQTDIGRALGTDHYLLRGGLAEKELDYLGRTRRFVEEEVLRVLLRVVRGECHQLSDTIAGLAKMHNPSRAHRVIATARDLLGGNGILLENHLIRHMADVEAIHTFEGTETIQTLVVGRDITGVGAFA